MRHGKKRNDEEKEKVMEFVPVNEHILVKAITPKKKDSLILSVNDEPITQYQVVSYADDVSIPLDEDDMLHLEAYRLKHIEIAGEKFYLIQEEFVLGVFKSVED